MLPVLQLRRIVPFACGLALAARGLAAAADGANDPGPASSWWAGWSAGYRLMDLGWKTSSSALGTAPIAPFDSVWKRVGAIESDLALTFVHGPVHVRGQIGYGQVVSGTNHLSGYADDSRSQELYRSDNSSDHGHLFEGALTVGVDWDGLDGFRLSPELGYSRSEQHLILTDGDQAIPNTGPYDGLHSSYDARWQGPLAGLKLAWFATDRITLSLHGAYHWARYDSQSDWNLRTDLSHPDSVEQHAEGSGVSAGFGISVVHSDHLVWWVKCEVERWRAGSGSDVIHYASGAQDTTGLVEAHADSRALLAGFLWGF